MDEVVRAGVAPHAETLRRLAHARAGDGTGFVVFAGVADERGVVGHQRRPAARERAAANPAGDTRRRIAHDQRGAVGRAERRALTHEVVAAVAGKLDLDALDLDDRAAAGTDAGQPRHAVGADGHVRDGGVGDLAAGPGGHRAEHGLTGLQAVLRDVDRGGQLGGEVHVLVAGLVVGGLEDRVDHVDRHRAVVRAGSHRDVHAGDGEIRRLAVGDRGGVRHAVGDVDDRVLVVAEDGVVARLAGEVAVGLAGRLARGRAGRLARGQRRHAEAQEHRERQQQGKDFRCVLHDLFFLL